MFKIKLHSHVEEITNSSTVIFTYQGACESKCIALIDAILETFALPGEATDFFWFGTFAEDYRYLESHLFESESDDDNERAEELKKLQLEIMKGNIERPDWMSDAEDWGDGFSNSMYLHIEPKDEKYRELANKIMALISAVDNEATRDG